MREITKKRRILYQDKNCKITISDRPKERKLFQKIITAAKPRVEPIQLANTLMNKYYTIKNIMRLPADVITRVEGVNIQLVCYLKSIAYFLKKARNKMTCVLSKKYEMYNMIDYLRDFYKNDINEIITYCFYDNKDKLMKKFVINSEHRDRVSMSFETLAEQFTDYEPTSIFLAHNHPSGIGQPSTQDLRFTITLALYCSMNRVKLIDHIISARNEVFSFRESGLLQKIVGECDYSKIAEEAAKEVFKF